MFGYVVPLKSKLVCADFAIYRSFYCGLCKTTGRFFGQFPRLTTNYDVTFLSVVLFEYAKTEYELENKGCILNPFRKKVSVCPNEMFKRISAANIILSYYKALDGVLDKEGLKYRILRNALKRAYKKAAALLPTVDGACELWYNNLRRLEKEGCESPDRVADCFANMLKETAAAVLDGVLDGTDGDNNLLSLFYNIGKFVYLADALDDTGDDFKKKRYNPFLAVYKGYKTRTEFIENNRDELTFTLAATVNRAIESFNNISGRFEKSGGLIRNILYYGLRAKCEELLSSKKKLKRPRI